MATYGYQDDCNGYKNCNDDHSVNNRASADADSRARADSSSTGVGVGVGVGHGGGGGDADSSSRSGVYGSGNSRNYNEAEGGDAYARGGSAHQGQGQQQGQINLQGTDVDASSENRNRNSNATYVGGDTNLNYDYDLDYDFEDNDVSTDVDIASDDDLTIEGDSYVYSQPPLAFSGFSNNVISGCYRILGFDFRDADRADARGASFGIPLPNGACKLEIATQQAFQLGNYEMGWQLYCAQGAVWKGVRTVKQAETGQRLRKDEAIRSCLDTARTVGAPPAPVAVAVVQQPAEQVTEVEVIRREFDEKLERAFEASQAK
jgi:hypothetical protein